MNIDKYNYYCKLDEKVKLRAERILEMCVQEQLTFDETQDLLDFLKFFTDRNKVKYLEKMPLEFVQQCIV